jgi:hypothetical protein
VFIELKHLIASSLAVVTLSASALGLGGQPASADGLENPTPVVTPVPSPVAVDPDIRLARELRPDLVLDVADLQIVFPRPDLVIRDWRVIPDAQPWDNNNDVKSDQPYRLCYTVANIGTAAAGPFKVAGGGLGVAFNPTNSHGGLAAGASAGGCLYYPDTPAPGLYFLSVTADWTHIVAESNEGNNSRVEPITVIP